MKITCLLHSLMKEIQEWMGGRCDVANGRFRRLLLMASALDVRH